MQTLDAGHIWRQIPTDYQDYLIAQYKGDPQLPSNLAEEFYEYTDLMGITNECHLTYMGKLLIQTCADVASEVT